MPHPYRHVRVVKRPQMSAAMLSAILSARNDVSLVEWLATPDMNLRDGIYLASLTESDAVFVVAKAKQLNCLRVATDKPETVLTAISKLDRVRFYWRLPENPGRLEAAPQDVLAGSEEYSSEDKAVS